MWKGRSPGGRAAHDRFGTILSDIQRFGRTTPGDRRRLRDLARTFGWSETGDSSSILADEDARQDEQVRRVPS